MGFFFSVGYAANVFKLASIKQKKKGMLIQVKLSFYYF